MNDFSTAIQPPPVLNDRVSVHESLKNKLTVWGAPADFIEGVERRRVAGEAKYGCPLQAFNGRDAVIDAYQEYLDALVYLEQKYQETGEYKWRHYLLVTLDVALAIHLELAIASSNDQ